MIFPEGRRGLFIFLGLLAVVFALAVVAYLAAGDMGIEERFSRALGGGEGEGPGEENGGGLALEGNLLSYVAVLGVLAAGCYILYRRFRV
ncbi:MAG: hypothetical protein LUQ25_02240 [Methanoregulaceae archaeon]|nr:hypothetical protein [Methanoregulaceae archaeon]